MMNLSRRDTLKLGGVAIAALAIAPARALAETEALIKEFAGGKTPKNAGLTLDIPVTAENANAVPVTIRLEDRFSGARSCEEFLLIAERNPMPEACRFRFSPATGMADVTTRIRLAESQTVVALARMSDGEILVHRVSVTVTVGGCNG
jgi:sulfur-oxidizing protein SoxY